MSEKHLRNVGSEKKGLAIRCNAGTVRTNRRGEFGGLKVWSMGDGIANVLSLGELSKLHHVTYDSKDGYFVVHTEKGEVRFVMDKSGMPCLDLASNEEAATMLIQTVRGNCEGYTPREVKEAREAVAAKALMFHPSEQTLKEGVSASAVANIPSSVNRSTISLGRRIFGPSLYDLRGKTTRRKVEKVREAHVSIPRAVADRLKFLEMAADIFFVDQIPFLLTVTRKIFFTTVEHTPVRTAVKLAEHLKKVLRVYHRAGYIIRTVLMDGEFEKLKPLLPKIVCNTTAAKEHVAEAERRIRVVKERTRGTLAVVPYDTPPRRMKIELVYASVFWLNAFPCKAGVSRNLSPRELVLRQKADFKKHCRVLFGSYCEVHDEPDPTNSTEPRTSEGIALGPSGNLQGTVKFLNLNTGAVVKRRKFTILPLTTAVKKQVDAMGERERQTKEWMFLDRNKEPFSWSNEVPDDDPQFQGLLEDDAPYPNVPGDLPGMVVEEGTADDAGPVQGEPAPNEEQRAERALQNAGLRRGPDPPRDEGASQIGPSQPPGLDNGVGEEEEEAEPDEDANGPDELVGAAAQDEQHLPPGVAIVEDDELSIGADAEPPNAAMDEPPLVPPNAAMDEPPLVQQDAEAVEAGLPGVPGGAQIDPHADEQLGGRRYPNRNRRRAARPRDQEYQFFGRRENSPGSTDLPGLDIANDDEGTVLAHLFAQFSLKQGLKKYGKRGEKSVNKELGALHDLEAWVPLDASKLTYQQRLGALSTVVFLKEKRDGSIKTRACVNGAPQRKIWKKEDAASPTPHLESVFITAGISAMEGRVNRCFDIPSAFPTTRTDEEVIMRLKGELADFLVNLHPGLYAQYVIKDSRGKSLLFVRLKKALYGLMRAALLFYRKFRGELEAYGFVVNDYDPCVANYTTAKGQQMTAVWHVDDVFTSCVEDFEITKFACYLCDIYGPKLTMHTGTKFDYLGMNLDFEGDGGVAIDMFKHVDNLLEEFPEEISGKAATPAAKHLFEVREDGEKLNEKDAEAYHHTTAQMLFIGSRARRDLQPVISFLTTRVKSPDKDDWGKVKRALKYINGTRRLKLRIKIEGVEDLINLLWYIDGAHCVHWDSRGHGGAALMMGKGAMTSYSNRLRMNTRSSTETEMVTVDRYMPEVLWTMYFLREQGFPVEVSRIAQDNEAAQLLETKGRFSSTSRTKHFKNKVFFVKDQVDQGEIVIVDCPTEKMCADFFTKAQQGSLFRIMRAILMGCDIEYVDPLDPAPKSKHHVDDKITRAPKTGVSTTRPSAQECVGQSAPRPANQRFACANSRVGKRRLWSEVVANKGAKHVRIQ